MNTNLQSLNWHSEEKRYFKEYREKVIELGRELLKKSEIKQSQLDNSILNFLLNNTMYAKTLLMDNILEILNQDTFTLEGVSQEIIGLMVDRGLLVEFPNL